MKRLYLLLILVLLLPFKVFADDDVVMLWCPENINGGVVMSCAVYVPEGVQSFSADLTLSNGMKLLRVTPNKNYSNESNNNIKFTLKEGGTSTTEIGFIAIESPEVNETFTTNVILKNIRINNKYVANYTSRIKVISKNPTTTTTTTTKKVVTSASSEPTTKKDNSPYMVRLDSNGGNLTEQSLECVPSSGQCTVDLTLASVPTKEGLVFNGWGSNKECEKGNTTSYIAKEDTILYACYVKSEDVIVENNKLYLQSLVIEDHEINFSKDVFEYSLDVSKDVSNINVMAVAEDGSVIINIEGNENLIFGNNIVKINLTKDDKSTSYIINVKRLSNDVSNDEVEDELTEEVNSKNKLFFDKYKKYFIIGGIVIFFIIVYIVVAISKKNEKTKKKNTTNKNSKITTKKTAAKEEEIEVLKL